MTAWANRVVSAAITNADKKKRWWEETRKSSRADGFHFFSPSLWHYWLWEVTGSVALLHVSPGRLMNDPQSCWLYPEQPAMYRHSDQPSIYNHIKTPRRPWLCVVASWKQTSWMFGAVVERGNVATGHQIMKKWTCCQVPHVRVFLHRCVCGCCVCVCAQQHCESGHTDVGSDGELDVWECKV